MSEQPSVQQGIEIDLDGKYVFTVPANMRPVDVQRLRDMINAFWQNDEVPFLILPDSVRLTKLEKDEPDPAAKPATRQRRARNRG